MPEGPEIRLAADRVGKAIERRRARQVFFAFDHLKPFEKTLSGLTVRRVEARGKAVLTRFSRGWNVYSHNQLYGRWFVQPAGELPRTRRSLRFAVHTAERSALLYSASDIEVLRDDELAAHPYLARLGPDPLDPALTARAVARRAAEDAFRRRSFAALLLDQGFLAGIGNYLRSEILFFAGLHPRARPLDCTPADLARLGRQALAVTRRSYRTRGLTNRPRHVAELRRQGWSRPHYRHAVFAREGGACWDCGTEIEKASLAGRRAYFCPRCQPAPRGPRNG